MEHEGHDVQGIRGQLVLSGGKNGGQGGEGENFLPEYGENAIFYGRHEEPHSLAQRGENNEGGSQNKGMGDVEEQGNRGEGDTPGQGSKEGDAGSRGQGLDGIQK